MDNYIKQIIHQKIKQQVNSVKMIGKGASGSVYEICCDGNPSKIAIKISKFYDLLQEEYNMLCFLSEQTKAKIP